MITTKFSRIPMYLAILICCIDGNVGCFKSILASILLCHLYLFFPIPPIHTRLNRQFESRFVGNQVVRIIWLCLQSDTFIAFY